MSASDTPASTKTLVGPMRLPFLVLTPACVLLGIGAGVYQSGRVDPLQAVVVLIGAVTAHISVNALNEYFDFRSGLDCARNGHPSAEAAALSRRSQRWRPRPWRAGSSR